MRTLVVNNQKGGVGKTMLACHLAWFLAEAEGARVAVFDFDPQGNASKVLSEGHDGGLASALFYGPDYPAAPSVPGITVFRADPALIHVQMEHVPAAGPRFEALADRFDYVVIDTPPSWGWRNYAALMVADHLLSPVDLEMFAIDGVTDLRKNVATVEKKVRGGRKVDFMGLLASRYQSNSPHQKANLQKLFASAGSLMFEGVVTQRQGYAQAMAAKAPVWTLPSSAQREAGRELRAIIGRVKDRMDKTAQERAA
jgi:chromosome partitioning protein